MAERANVLQKALKERNIDSMLEDARNDNKDTDAEHLQHRCEYYLLPLESKFLTGRRSISYTNFDKL